MEEVIIHHANCLDALRQMSDCSVDSIVTDPPYGLSFMGKRWDYDVPSVEIWSECLRVLKPGGHLLAFAGTRTQHRMAVRIEDAGFEIRDMIAWVYGSGFPKSLDVSKAIDKSAGAEREVVGSKLGMPGYHLNPHDGGEALGHGLSSSTYETRLKSSQITAPATDAASQWQGWGTALKPALEPITVARKPLIGTVAENVLAHGTGALNIDGCRVGTECTRRPINNIRVHGGADGAYVGQVGNRPCDGRMGGSDAGRWPANLIHDGSEEVAGLFPQTGKSTGGGKKNGDKFGGGYAAPDEDAIGYGDTGSAARFFYCAKASKRDRDADNNHPTVKPTDLMRYLCRLVTPPGGVILDPFMGSGSTGKAAVMEGFKFIGCEMNEEYVAIAKARIKAVDKQSKTSKQEDLFA